MSPFPVSASPVYLFVYGTLRRSDDFPRHDLLLPASFVGPGTLRGKLYDVGSYPGAVLSDADGDRVQGEVYLLHEPTTTFSRLDAYEGCTPDHPKPHEYLRQVVPVLMIDGEVLQAQAYLYNHSVEPLVHILSGDYLRHLRSHGDRQ